MVKDVATYKESLMTRKDKWGEQTCQTEEVKAAITQEPEAKPEEESKDSTTLITGAATTDTVTVNATTNDTAIFDTTAPQTVKHTNLWKLVS